MEITLTESLILLTVTAILLIGYGNRRAVTATASRTLIRDHIKGMRHRKQDVTMLVLKKRLSLLSSMLTLGALATLAAFVASVSIVFEADFVAKIAFVTSLVLGALSVLLAARESSLGNKSHFTELEETVAAHNPHHQVSS